MESVTEGFVRGRDAFERMNYLYQLSEYWSKTNPNLAAHYSKLMVSISKKSVLRLDHSIKRSVCKGCGAVLVENETVKSRYKNEHKGQMICTCSRCGVVKRYPCPKTKKS